MSKSVQVIVAGAEQEILDRCPSVLPQGGQSVHWLHFSVIRFEKTPVNRELLFHASGGGWDLVVFASSRAVKYFLESFNGSGFNPPEGMRAVCIGELTAEAAKDAGFDVLFCPSQPGTDCFLDEFKDGFLANPPFKKILIPRSEQGRTRIRDQLSAWGFEVGEMIVYRTRPQENLDKVLLQRDIDKSSLVLFTSPSSVDAFFKFYSLSPGVKVGSLGRFTGIHLEKMGFSSQKTLPGGDMMRIGELL